MNQATVNLNILGTKAKTKVELYRFLTVEAKLYLPPQREASIFFIRDIISSVKNIYSAKLFICF